MNKVQNILLKIAGFNENIANYCVTQYNDISSVGVFFIFQYICIYFSTYILTFDFVYNSGGLAFWSGLVISYLYAKITGKILIVFHKEYKKNILVCILLLNTILQIVISSILIVKIFENEILFDLDLRGNHFGDFKIIKHFVSIVYQVKTSKSMSIVVFFWLAIFLVLQFIFVNPYLQIYSFKNTLYNIVRSQYEHKF